MKVFTKAAIGLKQIFVLCFLAMLAVLCTACSNPMLNMHGKERISIVSYNAQTFCAIILIVYYIHISLSDAFVSIYMHPRKGFVV